MSVHAFSEFSPFLGSSCCGATFAHGRLRRISPMYWSDSIGTVTWIVSVLASCLRTSSVGFASVNLRPAGG